jgi:hypothetical protein
MEHDRAFVIRRGAAVLAATAAVIALSFAAPVSGLQREAAAPPQVTCPADNAMRRVELVFGTARPDGSVVSDADWNRFVDAEVTPRFPDGLTVLDASGQWRNSTGAIEKERSRILVILHRPAEATDQRIEAIRSLFKARFKQESVMRIDQASCVSF